MAQTDRFMIAPINSGQRSDLRPWLIPDDAFQILYNAYVFRGRVRKRFGSYLMNQSVAANVAQLYSRLAIQLPSTDGSGDATGNVPGIVYAPGQLFAIANQIYTVQTTGTPVTMLNTGAGTGTYDTSSGAYVFSGATATSPIYFYPATPVMGFILYEDDMLNNEPVFAFDAQFAYQFTGGFWVRLSSESLAGAATWTGNDSQFFWGYTWRGAFNSEYYLFVVNFNYVTASSAAFDYARYWDGAQWNFYYPILNGAFRLITARIVLPFKDRLIFLNTVENNEGVNVGTTNSSTGNFSGTVSGYTYTPGQQFLVGTTVYSIISDTAGAQAMGVTVIYNTANPNSPTPPTATFNVSTGAIAITGHNNNPNAVVYFLPNSTPTIGSGGTQFQYVNRCRYSWNGNPISANAFVDTIGGGGNYADAPTKEQIVSAEFLKDRLIVYFERSTWELVYTGNEILPFRWQQINTELGAEATFSTVPFDKIIVGVGNVGIHACNGSNVERIDNDIPDDVFNIENNNNGVYRVYGIRDYKVELVYWTFPDDSNATEYPNRVLVYNYKTGSWAFNIDSITAFGYYQSQPSTVWLNNFTTWEENEEEWNSGEIESHFRQIIGGNQEGFIFIIDPDISRNAPALQITDIAVFSGDLVLFTVINHNLVSLEYIALENIQGTITAPGGLNDTIYPVYLPFTADSFLVQIPGLTGDYNGGGTVARVSNLNIYTKQYNFYVQDGRNAYINKVDFYVDNETDGQVTVDYLVSSAVDPLTDEGFASGAVTGTGALDLSPYALYPFEQGQVRLWHPIYPLAEGECIQLHIYLSEAQIVVPEIAWSDFQLHAMTFYASPTSRLQ